MTGRARRARLGGRPRRRVAAVVSTAAMAAMLLLSVLSCEARGHRSVYVPVDPALRSSAFSFYPARTSARTDGHAVGSTANRAGVRALVIFFGNDIGFWAPHQDLAWRLSGAGYDVVGVDLRRWLATLPEGEPQRDSAFAVAMPRLLAEIRTEMRDSSLPIALAGHSFGAEVAFWIALHEPPRGLTGVLALNPRATGHLFITARDLLNEEASGEGSFSTVAAVGALAPGVRVAIVRGAEDPFRRHDPEFLRAGGTRLREYVIPLAAHSLKQLLLAGPIVDRAAAFVIGAPPG